MLALAERRTDEQIEADAEVETISRDEPDELIRKLQDAVGACATFVDYWFARNNLPAPPSPFAIALELMGRDLVHERTIELVERQIYEGRRRVKAELRVVGTDRQGKLL